MTTPDDVAIAYLQQALDLILDMSMALPSSDPRYRRAVTLGMELATFLRKARAKGRRKG